MPSPTSCDLSPDTNLFKDNDVYEDTEPRHAICTLLCTVPRWENLNHTDASALVVCRHVRHWHWCGFRRKQFYSPVLSTNNQFFSFCYSERKDSTGFAKADFIVLKLMVKNAMSKVVRPANAYTHHCTSIL